MAIFGYCRTSTDEQRIDGQIESLKAAGAIKVFAEAASGANANRPELQKLLKKLQHGDTLLVTRLDRLARSTRDLLNILHSLGEKGVGFRSLNEAAFDTTTPMGELVVTILASLATFERHLIMARTSEGRKRAKERGVKFGRKPKLSPFQQAEALERLGKGDSQTAVARTFGVDQTTISSLARSRMAA